MNAGESQTHADLRTLSYAAAELFARQATVAVATQGRFSATLSGGTTPKSTYEFLSQAPLRDTVPWKHVHLFWGDERCVPPDDARSNYRMTKRALLDQVPIPPANVHRIRGEIPPAEGAAAYEAALRDYFGSDAPSFDLMLLGVGTNAHTASLFPHTPVLAEKNRWAAEVYVAETDLWRVTLTAPILKQAALTVFVVSGADKAAVVHDIRFGSWDPDRKPAQLIQPVNGRLLWLLDRTAALVESNHG